jgi:glycosyltransferase involved in cell wall biosynthesis
MKIAQVSPLIESVPPRGYGGIERVVHYLTEELVARGHEVTLFASGDSKTSADLVSVTNRSLRHDGNHQEPLYWHMIQMAEIVRLADKFDIVHFHIDTLHYALWRNITTPQVTTLHHRTDNEELKTLYREYDDMSIISISDSQRKPIPHAKWAGTVYNGVPRENYTFCGSHGEYFAFLGRLAPEKGPEVAIEIAKRSNTPLKIAAKIDRVDQKYFTEIIEPLLDHPLIEFIGEVNEKEKDEFLGNAKALLFPINWPEPFGLVMTESMACGTPVIAFRRGSVEEIIVDGKTGFIVDNVEQALEATMALETIDRKNCRTHFEEKFSVSVMTDGYLEIYRNLTHDSETPRWTVPIVTENDVEPVSLNGNGYSVTDIISASHSPSTAMPMLKSGTNGTVPEIPLPMSARVGRPLQ